MSHPLERLIGFHPEKPYRFHQVDPVDAEVDRWWDDHELVGDTSTEPRDEGALDLIRRRIELLETHNVAGQTLSGRREINRDTVLAGSDPSLPEYTEGQPDEATLEANVLETNRAIPQGLQAEHPEAQ